jgi:hypothetical protein
MKAMKSSCRAGSLIPPLGDHASQRDQAIPSYTHRKRPPTKRRDLAATRSLMRALSQFNLFAL